MVRCGELTRDCPVAAWVLFITSFDKMKNVIIWTGFLARVKRKAIHKEIDVSVFEPCFWLQRRRRRDFGKMVRWTGKKGVVRGEGLEELENENEEVRKQRIRSSLKRREDSFRATSLSLRKRA